MKLTNHLIYLMCFVLMAENAFAVVTEDDINAAYHAGNDAIVQA